MPRSIQTLYGAAEIVGALYSSAQSLAHSIPCRSGTWKPPQDLRSLTHHVL